MLKTRSVNVFNLCIPCACRCRYCLLAYNGQTSGVEYERSVRFADAFRTYIKQNRPELDFLFYYGYSMEHPNLAETLDYFNSYHSVNGKFLQFNGMEFRDLEHIKSLMRDLRLHGVETIDLTFYGIKDYHDKFAVRRGDFDYLMQIMNCAISYGIHVRSGITLTNENVNQIERLIEQISKSSSIRLFIPHSEGRGKNLENIRFTQDSLELLSTETKKLLDRSFFKTEKEWISSGLDEYENRVLNLSLTKENLALFENMPFDRIIEYLEKLDDDYYGIFPNMRDLVDTYYTGSDKFFSKRDLIYKYQKQYIAGNLIKIYDVTDERQSGSRRY